jgi:hypothetical protein
MALHAVQLSTDPEPRPFYDVDDGEYERLLSLGLVVNAPADPEPADLFDTEVAALINDGTSATHGAGILAFTQTAQSVAPSSPFVGQLWFSFT